MGILEGIYVIIFAFLIINKSIKFMYSHKFTDFINIVIVVLVFAASIYIANVYLNLSISFGIINKILEAITKMNFYSYIILLMNLVLLFYNIKHIND